MVNSIMTPQDAIAFAKDELLVKDDARERCVMITITKGNRPIRTHLVGLGSYEKCMADARYVAKEAVLDNATGVILLHTHTGDSKPSKSDITTTDSIRRGLSCLDISLIDHIIVGYGEFFSFSDEKVEKMN